MPFRPTFWPTLFTIPALILLLGLGSWQVQRLFEKEEGNPAAALDYQQRNLMAFAATEEVPYDSSGRIVLPPMMRRKGGIEDLALYLGTGETFQIWSPKLFLADKNVPEDMKDIARFRLEERGQ